MLTTPICSSGHHSCMIYWLVTLLIRNTVMVVGALLLGYGYFSWPNCLMGVSATVQHARPPMFQYGCLGVLGYSPGHHLANSRLMECLAQLVIDQRANLSPEQEQDTHTHTQGC